MVREPMPMCMGIINLSSTGVGLVLV